MHVVIGELPSDEDIVGSVRGGPNGESKNSRLGMTIRDLSATEREQNDLGDAGVLVEDVEQGPAFDAGLRPGDVITQINSKSVASVSDLQDEVKKLKPGARVPVLVQRQGSPLFMAIKIPADSDKK